MPAPTTGELSRASAHAISAFASPELEASRWFEQEVRAHDSSLRNYLRGSFPAVRGVDDVVQESYLRVWRRQMARPIASAKSFLFKVARHLALDAIRHELASPIEDVGEFTRSSVIEDRQGVGDAACTNEEVEMLFKAIEALPARCREIVILRKLRGMSQKDIARKLGIAESTVQVQARRGLRRCEEYLRAQGVIRAVRA